MRFESFISALDMGQCEDQLQRQALFDIALLFVNIDGVVTDSETQFMHDWLASIPWNGDVSKETYYVSTQDKCEAAIKGNQIEDFIAHRARQMMDPCIKEQALKLAHDISNVDGELDQTELAALAILNEALGE